MRSDASEDRDDFTILNKSSNIIRTPSAKKSTRYGRRDGLFSESKVNIIISRSKNSTMSTVEEEPKESYRSSVSDSKLMIKTKDVRQDESTFMNNSKTSKPRVLTNKSIEEDLRVINIPEVIKERANKLYMKFLESSPKKNFRELSKDAIKFAFIFKAYYTMNIHVDANEIIKRMGITEKKDRIIKKGMSISFMEEDGTRKDTYFTPIEMIPGYLNIFGLPLEWLEHISTLYESLQYYHEDLLSSIKPQTIAVGMIYFYSIYVMKINIDKKTLCTETNSSQNAITKVYNALFNTVSNS